MKTIVLTLASLAFLAGCNGNSNKIDSMNIPQSEATMPEGKDGQWWLNRHNAFNKIAAGGDIDLVFLGDSISQNWERNGKDVWQHYYGHRKAANFGINSDETRHVLYRVQNGNFDGISPRLVVLLIGTNNHTAGQETAEGVLAVVQAIRRKCPDTKVLMLAIFPRGKDATDTNRPDNAKASTIFGSYADGKDVFYKDIGQVFMNADGSISPEIMKDFVHLSPKGYQLWAAAIEPEISSILGDEPVKPL